AKLRAGPCSKPWSTGRMTMRPVPPRRPWLSMRARLVRVPAFSLSYQERISLTRFSMACRPFRRRRLLTVEVFGERHVVGTADEDRLPLVVFAGLDVEDALGARAGSAAGLLGEHAHRRHFVEEPELGLGLGRVAHVGRVHEYAAVEECPVHVGHHGA